MFGNWNNYNPENAERQMDLLNQLMKKQESEDDLMVENMKNNVNYTASDSSKQQISRQTSSLVDGLPPQPPQAALIEQDQQHQLITGRPAPKNNESSPLI